MENNRFKHALAYAGSYNSIYQIKESDGRFFNADLIVLKNSVAFCGLLADVIPLHTIEEIDAILLADDILSKHPRYLYESGKDLANRILQELESGILAETIEKLVEDLV